MKKILVVLIILVVALSGGIIFYLSGIGAADPGNDEEITVEIPNGSGASAIVAILDEHGLIKNMTCAKIKYFCTTFVIYSRQGFYVPPS